MALCLFTNDVRICLFPDNNQRHVLREPGECECGWPTVYKLENSNSYFLTTATCYSPSTFRKLDFQCRTCLYHVQHTNVNCFFKSEEGSSWVGAKEKRKVAPISTWSELELAWTQLSFYATTVIPTTNFYLLLQIGHIIKRRQKMEWQKSDINTIRNITNLRKCISST